MNIIYPSETVQAISEFLFIGEEAEELPVCDLTIVLGNDDINGTIAAVDSLVKKGIIDSKGKIILSGATGLLNAGKEKECLRMLRCAVEDYSLPRNLFLLEERATNAYENLKFSKELVTDMGGFDSFNNILFLGKAFMMRRTKMGASVLCYPAEKLHYYGTVDKAGRNIGKDCWWKTESASVRVFQELERIGKYSVKGDLGIF